jgi:cytochrome c oxidase subunit 1
MTDTALPGRITPDYFHDGHTLGSWLTTTDHKRIALLFAFSITLFFFIGATAIGIVRLELLTPTGDLVSDDT